MKDSLVRKENILNTRPIHCSKICWWSTGVLSKICGWSSLNSKSHHWWFCCGRHFPRPARPRSDPSKIIPVQDEVYWTQSPQLLTLNKGNQTEKECSYKKLDSYPCSSTPCWRWGRRHRTRLNLLHLVPPTCLLDDSRLLVAFVHCNRENFTKYTSVSYGQKSD